MLQNFRSWTRSDQMDYEMTYIELSLNLEIVVLGLYNIEYNYVKNNIIQKKM